MDLQILELTPAVTAPSVLEGYKPNEVMVGLSPKNRAFSCCPWKRLSRMTANCKKEVVVRQGLHLDMSMPASVIRSIDCFFSIVKSRLPAPVS